MLYLAEVCKKKSFLGSRIELKVLAALQADNSWVEIQLKAYVSAGAIDKFKLGDWVLVDLDSNQKVISVQPATRQIIGLLKNSADFQGKAFYPTSESNGVETFNLLEQEDKSSSTLNPPVFHPFSQAKSPQEAIHQNSTLKNDVPALRFLQPSGGNGILNSSDLTKSPAQTKNHQFLPSHQFLKERLLEALEKNELSLYYQPSVHLQTKNIIAVEAFIRWNSLGLHVIPPSQIITLAEEDELIYGISHWVFENACLQVKIWHEKGFCPLKISVNLSSKQILENGFTEKLKTTLNNINFNPGELELEISENMFLETSDKISKIIHNLKQLELHTTLDHFSGNFEMFQYFQSHLFDVVKIDRNLIQKATQKEEELEKLKAIIMLAKSCNLQIIAEGVEKREQLDLLNSIHCEAVQGYLIDHPLSVVDATDVLQANWLGRPII